MITMKRSDALVRAYSMVGALLAPPPNAPEGTPSKPIAYRLGYGAKNPLALHPGQPSYGDRTWTADCSAFVAWCLGLARNERMFPHWGGDICTTAIVEASDMTTGWFQRVANPRPGDLCVYPNRYLLGVRVGVGHVGMILSLPAGWMPGDSWAGIQVAHCSAGSDRKLGHAIAVGSGSIWEKKGRFVRFLKFAGE